MHDEIQLAVRKLIRSSPWIYSRILNLRGLLASADRRPAQSQLVSASTDLCIEGYPSSGNSVVVNLVGIHYPRLQLAAHTHSVANVKLALDFGVPVLVPFRAPEEAVASRVVRFGKSIRLAVGEYVAFNEYALRHRDRVTLVEFSNVLSEPRTVLNWVSEVQGVEGVAPADPLGAVEQRMRDWFAARGQMGSGLPNRAKETKKRAVKAAIERDPRWTAARNVYLSLRALER